jgi:Fe2+ or Zn2+ uptake regulation protein
MIKEKLRNNDYRSTGPKQFYDIILEVFENNANTVLSVTDVFNMVRMKRSGAKVRTIKGGLVKYKKLGLIESVGVKNSGKYRYVGGQTIA